MAATATKPGSITKLAAKKSKDHSNGNTKSPNVASAFAVLNVKNRQKNNSKAEFIFIAICNAQQKPWMAHNFGRRMSVAVAEKQLRDFLSAKRR